MSIKNAHKIGFLSALCICVGSVVGIGIFFKNSGIGATTYDGITWLMAWIIGGFTALLVAVHFGRISRMDHNSETYGMSGWSRIVTKKESKKWFANLVSVNYTFFYNSIIGVILSFFAAEMLVDFIFILNGQKDWAQTFPIWALVLIAIGIFTIITTGNLLSSKYTSWVSQLSLFLKSIPLIFAVFVGIIFPYVHNANGFNDFETIANPLNSFKGLILSLPSVLFAFDAFIGIGALTDRVKNGKKVVSKIIVLGMVSVLVLYILIAISSILHASDNTFISNVIADSLPKEAAYFINILIAFFLFISVYGTTNSLNACCLSELDNLIRANIIFGLTRIKNKIGHKKTKNLLMILSSIFWMILIFVPSAILDNDQLIDGFSNFPIVFFFIVYAVMIYYYWKNIYQKNNHRQELFYKSVYQKSYRLKKIDYYTIFVWITIIMVFAVVGINMVVVFISGITEPNRISTWGLYKSISGIKLTNLHVLIIYIIALTFFIALPVINFQLVKKIEKRKAIA